MKTIENNVEFKAVNLNAASLAKLESILRITGEARNAQEFLSRRLIALIEDEGTAGHLADFLEGPARKTALVKIAAILEIA